MQAHDREGWEILWESFLSFTDTVLPAGITQTTWRRLIDPVSEPNGLVASDDTGRIIGFAHFLTHRSTWSDKPYCYLEDLYVDQANRRTGAARALIAAVETEARTRGCSEMYLVTADDNTSARALYDQVMETTPFIEYRTNLT